MDGEADKKRMPDRRLENRMLCADIVQVRWKDQADRSRESTALLEDISRSGTCLQFEVEIPIGTSVRIACGSEQFEGVVRYCTYREIGYFVGVEFQEGTEWSKECFEPQHLLDPGKLLDKNRRE